MMRTKVPAGRGRVDYPRGKRARRAPVSRARRLEVRWTTSRSSIYRAHHGVPPAQLLRPGDPVEDRCSATRSSAAPPSSPTAVPPLDRHALRAARPCDRRGTGCRRRALPRGRTPSSRLHPHAAGERRAPGRARSARAAGGRLPAAYAVGHGGDVESRERDARLALSRTRPTSARRAATRCGLDHVVSAAPGAPSRLRPTISCASSCEHAPPTATAGRPRLIADGLCLASVWLMALDRATLMTQRARGLEDPRWPRRRSRSSPLRSQSR